MLALRRLVLTVLNTHDFGVQKPVEVCCLETEASNMAYLDCGYQSAGAVDSAPPKANLLLRVNPGRHLRFLSLYLSVCLSINLSNLLLLYLYLRIHQQQKHMLAEFRSSCASADRQGRVLVAFCHKHFKTVTGSC